MWENNYIHFNQICLNKGLCEILSPVKTQSFIHLTSCKKPQSERLKLVNDLQSFTSRSYNTSKVFHGTITRNPELYLEWCQTSMMKFSFENRCYGILVVNYFRENAQS